MGQMSVQYTPVQVLQAARRAEAEGKMDYALQFYRHLVEHHGMTAEAQEAREGLFRIAEWRWGEARVARRQDVANGQGGGQQSYAPAPSRAARLCPSARAAGAHAADHRARGGEGRRGRQAPPFKARYRSRQEHRVSAVRRGLGERGRRHRVRGFGVARRGRRMCPPPASWDFRSASCLACRWPCSGSSSSSPVSSPPPSSRARMPRSSCWRWDASG